MNDLEKLEEEEEVRTLMLEYEDGTEVECIIRAVLEYEGTEYVALLPMGEDEYQIFGFKDHGEEVEIIPIEDEEVYEKVLEIFDDYFYNEEEYEEDEEDFDEDEYEEDLDEDDDDEDDDYDDDEDFDEDEEEEDEE
ncbi:MAG: DUF1292 domain-containing protein [Candidatus Cloacimonetes bacterium]|nr:DUF1292 domain-containing protein [Candidatus Cloacimonadota bacterium]